MIVLTAGYGDHAELMRLTEQRHRRWTEKLQAKHVLTYGRLNTEYPDRDGCWDKLVAIQRQLKQMPDGELLVWVEPDVLVQHLDAKVSDVMSPDADWGMVWRPDSKHVHAHYCTGVQVFRNSARVRAILDEIWELGPLPGLFPGDCRPTNYVLNGRMPRWPIGITAKEASAVIEERVGLKVHPLPWTWNCHLSPIAPSAAAQDEAVMLHWSRQPKSTVLRRMRSRLKKLEAKEQYQPMDRTTAWQHDPATPLLADLTPDLAAARAVASAAPKHPVGVLFFHHRVDALTTRNMRSIQEHNPGIPVVPIATEVEVYPNSYRLNDNPRWVELTKRRGRACWRNLDWAAYLWYLDRTIDCQRWMLADWDLHCTGPLDEFYGPTWGDDAVCAHPAHQAEPWHWFCETDRMPESLRSYAAGVVPMAGTLLSDRCLEGIVRHAHLLSFDLFAELRMGTLVQAAGYQITECPHSNTLRYVRRPVIKGRGLWHPVKEWSTLEAAKRE